MTRDRESPEARALDAIVAEAREDLLPREAHVDWARIEATVMQRVQGEEPALVEDVRTASSGRARATRVGAMLLAAAAVAAVIVRRDRDASLLDPPAAEQPVQNGSALRATEGAGELRIGSVVPSAGYVIRNNDVIEADRLRAIFERPRKVTWLIEPDGEGRPPARAIVKSVAESLVLGLEEGAIEAQVTPVPAGEAFAVDVAAEGKQVRVAVHGTHLRVTRRGKHVVVDLNEGVVSIGVPPRSGSTYGALVSAPAHVELDVDDLEHSMRVDHAPASVRAPVPLAPHEPTFAGLVRAPEPTAPEPSKPAPPVVRAPLPKHEAGNAVEHPGSVAAAPSSSTIPPANLRPPPAREGIATAVRRCASATYRASDVRVTVTSTLKLGVSPTGDVLSAQFDPPLLPEVQSCAAASIYKMKLDEPNPPSGTVTIPIEFSY